MDEKKPISYKPGNNTKPGVSVSTTYDLFIYNSFAVKNQVAAALQSSLLKGNEMNSSRSEFRVHFTGFVTAGRK